MKLSGIGKPAGCKLIRFDASIENGIVERLSVRGDFFAIPEEGFEKVEARLKGMRLEELAARFDALCAEEGVQCFGISGVGLAETIRGAIDGA